MSADRYLGPVSQAKIETALQVIDDLRALLYVAKRTGRAIELCNGSVATLLRRCIEQCKRLEETIAAKGEP